MIKEEAKRITIERQDITDFLPSFFESKGHLTCKTTIGFGAINVRTLNENDKGSYSFNLDISLGFFVEKWLKHRSISYSHMGIFHTDPEQLSISFYILEEK